MPWQPGQSGNPKGGPKKERSLTKILAEIGSESVEIQNPAGATTPTTALPKARVLAQAVWELLLNGTHVLPSGAVLRVDTDLWISLTKWFYLQVDGPAKSEMDVNNQGEVVATLRVVHESWKEPEGSADDRPDESTVEGEPPDPALPSG